MCCITIETDVLMANFFGSPKCGQMAEEGVELEKIERCARVLANNLPGYVFYDLTQKKIISFMKENKDFILQDNKISYHGRKINRNKYNNIYSEKISSKISEVVDAFFDQKLYDKDIKILMPVQG